MTSKVLITDYVWPSIEPERTVLSKIGVELIIAPDGNEETLVKMVENVNGILTCFAKVTPNVIKAAKKCVVIGRFGVGVDNISVETATELGIAVTYVPDYCMDEVAEHVLAMLLAWNRRIVMFDNSVKTDGWGSLPLSMRIMRLRGKKLGVIGFGRIGNAVATRAAALGLEILTFDPNLTAEVAIAQGVRMVSLTTLLEESDFVTLHAPLTTNTENLIGKDQLNMMKKDAFLINAARGGLINENDLYDALINGKIAGAGLDVMVDPSPSVSHPLLGLNNVIVTPHTAFFSQESVLELEVRAAEEVARVLTGTMPQNLVNMEVLSHPNPRHSLRPR